MTDDQTELSKQPAKNDHDPVTDEEWEQWQVDWISKFELENYPLKYEKISPLILAEYIIEVVRGMDQDCRECPESYSCAALILERKVNISRVKSYKNDQRRLKRERKEQTQKPLTGVEA